MSFLTRRCCMMLLFFTLSYVTIYAKHIIGGEIVYKSTGIGKYALELRMYRDCQSKGGAEYDLDAITYLGIYTVNALNGQHRFVKFITAASSTKASTVSPDDNPCLILPPNVCVEQKTYFFETSLPVIDETYYISYQRCCRNETITNIRTPGDVGATYTIEITGESQKTQNNSPIFKKFPPIVICAGEDVNFDHSASDKENDQLVYEFCSPLIGGGKGGSDNTTPASAGERCDGVRPLPPCLPPYNTVSFTTGYSPTNPLNGDPIVTINSTTGKITGIPKIQGQYVVGVCVSEYRNGKLLSRLRRDFQFNVAQCEPAVFAKIKSDLVVLGKKQFVITACGDSTVIFKNESTLERYIQEYRWEFNIKGVKKTYNTRDITVAFPDTGLFKGLMIVNPGLKCSDTAVINARIYPKSDADFKFAYDTCIAGPVQFTDLSKSRGNVKFKTWQWTFADKDTSRLQSPAHLYKKPGIFNVKLIATDVNGCKGEKTKPVKWQPVPPLVVIEPSSANGCAPLEVYFKNLSSPIDSTYKIDWTFGDEGKGNKISPTHLYAKEGNFDVSVNITSPIGCKTSRSYSQLIKVLPSAKADFTFLPEKVTTLNPIVTFTDQSKGTVASWSWFFGEKGGIANQQNPTYTFRDTGLHVIMLRITHPSGCIDTLTKRIDVTPVAFIYMPNAFTPNADGINDVFIGRGIMDGARDYNFTIWNRWGEKVFGTNNPNEGWNGKNFGSVMQAGMYVYLITFKNPRGELIELKGYATLIL
jgi:gliding motility-associated-like protein